MKDFLEEFISHKEIPHFTDEKGYSYYLIKKTEKQWLVKKLAQNYSVVCYEVHYLQGRWVCDCPAGYRGNKCKHSSWISLLTPKAHFSP